MSLYTIVTLDIKTACFKSLFPQPKVSWRKLPYNVPITVGKDQFLEIDRFKLFRVPYQGEWNLHIKNAQPFDSGTYECQVSLKGEKIRRNITLTVLGKLYKYFESLFCWIKGICSCSVATPPYF